MADVKAKGRLKKVSVTTKKDEKDNTVTMLDLKLEIEGDVKKVVDFLTKNGELVEIGVTQLQLTLPMKKK